jgi:hypothetical protein
MPEFPNSVSYTATGEDIFQIVAKIQPILEPERVDLVIMACLAIVMMIMNPNLTSEELQAGIKGCSQWICTFLETTQAALDYNLAHDLQVRAEEPSPLVEVLPN